MALLYLITKKMQKDIFVSKNNTMNAMKGHKVVVKISDWGGEDKKNQKVKLLRL